MTSSSPGAPANARTRIGRIGLRGRIVLTVAGAAVLMIVALTGASILFARHTILASAEEHLAATAELKANRLGIYLRGIGLDLRAIAGIQQVASELPTLARGLAEAGTTTLHAAYIDANPHPAGKKHLLDKADGAAAVLAPYNAAHARLHPMMRGFLDGRGYYDIFLVTPAGDVVYSVFKERDFATNLKTGAHATSGLGEAFRDALDAAPDSVSFRDFKAYAPSNGMAAAFLATPIDRPDGAGGTTRLGVLAVQLPVDRLSQVVNFGGGDTGATAFLVGSDGLLRSDLPQTEAIDVLNTRIDIESLSAEGLIRMTDLLGRPAIARSAKVSALGTSWYAVETLSESVIEGKTWGTEKALALTAAVAMALALVLAWFSGSALTRPVVGFIASARQLAAGERVTIPGTERTDELGELARNLAAIDAVALERLRINAALESASRAIVVTDADLRILFANREMRSQMAEYQPAIRDRIPGFTVETLIGRSIDIFQANPEEHRRQLAALERTMRGRITLGSFTIDTRIRPVNEDGERIGYIVEWDDRTDLLQAEQACAAVITRAGRGDFSGRVEISIDDAFVQNLAEGLNTLCTAVDGFVEDLSRALGSLAAGDLRARLDGSYDGQLDQIAGQVERTATELARLVDQVKFASGAIAGSSSELARGSGDLSQRTESQAASIEETSAAMEEISATVKANAENAAQADSRASQAAEQAEAGRSVVAETVAAMSKIRDSATQISEITSVIDSIAFQTNLLALNAAVEAARAGEAGRGFAVVASEVGTLAKRSSDAAKNIKELIVTSAEHVAEGGRLVESTDAALAEILASVRNAADIIKEIATASREQAVGLEEITMAVGEMDEMTQQNATLADHSSSAAQKLIRQAGELSDLVRVFATENSISAETTGPEIAAADTAAWDADRSREGGRAGKLRRLG